MKRLASALFLLVAVMATGERKPKPAEPKSAHVGMVERGFHPKAVRNWRGAEKQELHVVVWYPAPVTAVEVQQVIGPPGAALFEAAMASPNAPLVPAMKQLPLI